ncbi:hypothetical protein GIB67_035943 [Kingdonia uniflora]|uniref:Cytochrome P450 n=1 Tax=Kingdonia uniflora TaxID=39325 RepID=A0A7J7N164_9MAGN|nr:hypothetical protein GIB67_035943 [Kingdonia uniflora]
MHHLVLKVGPYSVTFYISDRLHEDFFHLAKTHGPLFSLCLGQKPAIVISSPEVAREYLTSSKFSSRAITEVARYLAFDASTVVFGPYGARWRLLRKIMNTEVFSARAIELLQPGRAQKIGGKEELRRYKEQPVRFLDFLLDNKSDKEEDVLKQLSKFDIKGLLAISLAFTLEVLAELDDVVGKNKFVEETDIPKLIYFQAVIKEVFRLHPGVPLNIPRSSDEPCDIYGYHVPKNTIVFVNIWGITRDPKIWTDPYVFKPERFIGNDMDVKGQNFEILPFGAGRRSYVGMP